MATVELCDIVTEADRQAALAVRRAPGQERFVASVEKSFVDALDGAEAYPQMWTVNAADVVVGFVLICDGIPDEILVARDLIGPYFLWRLLIDERHQRQCYGTAALEALVAYLSTRPGADALYLTCHPGDDGPQAFYERFGFVASGQIKWEEVVMRLDLPRATGAGSATV